jgi:hypothetical protein
VQKHNLATTTPAPALRKASEKCVRRRRLSHSRNQTSARKLALAKPLKHGNKFVAKSSELRLVDKPSIAGIDIAGKKKSSTSVGGSSVTHALTCVLNLFDSNSSDSGDESAPPGATP